jgi:glycosyltransferase involved in cell wall biosynthesis
MFENKGGRHFWFAQNLKNYGYETTIFCANTFHQKIGSINLEKKNYKKIYTNNIPFIFIKTIPSISNGFKRILNMLIFYINLLKVTKTLIKNGDKPDLILASSVHPMTLVAGVKLGKLFNIPVICEIRDLWPEAIFSYNKLKEKSILGRLLVISEYWIYKNANALIFTKEGDVDYLKEKKWTTNLGGKVNLDKVFYINNGVDIENFNTSVLENFTEDNDLNSGKFNVIYIGSIRPVNDVENIINTAIELKSMSDIQFLIYGDGSLRNKLEEKVKTEGLENVKIKGYINKKFIPYILSKSSVNLLNYSSTQYNWTRGCSSNKLFEYLASGKPVISNVKMGYSIVIKYQCGFELENNNPINLKEKILTLRNMHNDQYLEICNNAINAANNFDFKILTSKLVDVVNKLI